MVDYYKILGLKVGCTKEELKSAFREMTLKYHPDRISSAESPVDYVKVVEAYKHLSEIIKSPSSPPDIKDYTNSPPNVYSTVEASVKELIFGFKPDVVYTRFVLCRQCSGDGCDACSSSGFLSERAEVVPIIPPETIPNTKDVFVLLNKGNQRKDGTYTNLAVNVIFSSESKLKYNILNGDILLIHPVIISSADFISKKGVFEVESPRGELITIDYRKLQKGIDIIPNKRSGNLIEATISFNDHGIRKGDRFKFNFIVEF